MATTTGTNQDQAFIIQLLKSYKMDYENSTTNVERQQAAAKADALRVNAKLQGVDLPESVWGQNVPLERTPGGKSIDFNMLSTVGKAWASTNPIDDVSRWKQQVGTGLTQNLAGYQAQFANASEQGAYGAMAGTPAATGSAVGAPVTVPKAVPTASSTGAPTASPAAAPAVQQPVSLVPPGYADSASFQFMLNSLGLGQFAPVKLGR